MVDNITIDARALAELGDVCRRLGSTEFKRKVGTWLDAQGFVFLDEVKAEIVRSQTVDTRRLLNSFEKGTNGNVWRINNGGLELHVGTNVKYAEYVNSGHSTTPSGVSQRWVPGVWNGDKFTYVQGAQTGMLLREKWVEGTHYFDNAVAIFDRMFGESLDRNLQQWLSDF